MPLTAQKTYVSGTPKTSIHYSSDPRHHRCGSLHLDQTDEGEGRSGPKSGGSEPCPPKQ